jgi:hypothetical protein
LVLYKRFVKLIHGFGTNAQSAEPSSTSVSVIEPIHQVNEAYMNELLILRAAMEDIAAGGSEKANIAIVLADQARKRQMEVGGRITPTPVPKSAVDEILTLVQDANVRLSAAIRANSTGWSASTDSRIEEARAHVNKIATALVKDRK